MSKSHHELLFADTWQRRYPKLRFVREYVFHPKRKWRFDFAWPGLRTAVEIEGGTFARGRHTRGVAYAKDCDKYNAAVRLGWKVLRFTDYHMREVPIVEICQEVYSVLSEEAVA